MESGEEGGIEFMKIPSSKDVFDTNEFDDIEHIEGDYDEHSDAGEEENDVMKAINEYVGEDEEDDDVSIDAIENAKEFLDIEIKSSNYNKQIKTVSTLICFFQFVIYLAMTQDPGFHGSSTSTAAFSPHSAHKFGSIFLRNNGFVISDTWRLFSAIFVHDGFINLFCNLFIQIMFCGYLSLLFGTKKYLFLYIICGVFGNMLSYAGFLWFQPCDIPSGSAYSILGVLSAWCAWIVVRWNYVPGRYQWLRNGQLGFIGVGVFITCAWAVLFRFKNAIPLCGSSIVGFVLGLWAFRHFMDESSKLRMFTSFLSLSLTIGAFVYVAVVMLVF